jgi:hypothetical protein
MIKKNVQCNKQRSSYQRKIPAELAGIDTLTGGELGIRTPGGVTLNGFQDRRNRPLCQLSGAKVHFELYSPKKLFRFLKVLITYVLKSLPSLHFIHLYH